MFYEVTYKHNDRNAEEVKYVDSYAKIFSEAPACMTPHHVRVVREIPASWLNYEQIRKELFA